MKTIFWDIVGKEIDEKQIFDMASFAASNSMSLVIFSSQYPKNIVQKIKRKKFSNLKMIDVGQDTTPDQTVQDFVVNFADDTTIFIKRGIHELKLETLSKMIEDNINGKKIVCACNKKSESIFNKFKMFLTRIALRSIYDCNVFEGKGELILFDSAIVRAMKQNSSAALRMTKIDNYKFVQRSVVMQEDLVIKKNNKSPKHSIRLGLSVCGLIMSGLILAMLLVFVPALRIAYFIIPMTLLTLGLLCVTFVFFSNFVMFKNVGHFYCEDIKTKKEIIK